MKHSKILKTTNNNIYIKTKDFLVTKEEFSLIEDHNKKFLKTTPKPSNEDLSRYYETEQYVSHTDSKKGLLNFLYQTIKRYSLKKKVKLINKLNSKSGKLLDIGAGTGDFLIVAKNKGWDVEGVEVNRLARDLAIKKGITLRESMIGFKEKQFDVITLWHVLEHLPNLEKSINDIETLLKDNGILIIAVPNFNSYDAKHYQGFWAAYDVPRHLWHFSQESMKLIFSNKMKLIKKKPMLFDAFYVSLLSEKYKKGKPFSLKGLWVGLKSNLSAMRTMEYSSLIYVFKRSNDLK